MQQAALRLTLTQEGGQVRGQAELPALHVLGAQPGVLEGLPRDLQQQPLLRLQRPGWQAAAGDVWHRVASLPAAAALADPPLTMVAVDADVTARHIVAVVTALVAQNTCGVREVHTPPQGFLRAQLDAVVDDVTIDAIKIGMVADGAIAAAIADVLSDLAAGGAGRALLPAGAARRDRRLRHPRQGCGGAPGGLHQFPQHARPAA